jgi:CHAT domain-containing protein/tetratricopeptide (TPR) repeat protein
MPKLPVHTPPRTLAALVLGALGVLGMFVAGAWPSPCEAQAAGPSSSQKNQRIDDKQWQALADRSEALLAKGELPEAESAGRDALAEAKRVFGDSQVNTAASFSILGGVLLKQGKFGEAEEQFREALNIYERRSGADSVNTASALNNLALVLEKLADYRGAELLLRRAHRILEQRLGPDHADTGITLLNLGRVLDSQGKFGASAAVAAAAGDPARAASRAAPVPGTPDPQALAARAGELASKGEYGEAETLQQRVVAIHEKTLGPEHPQTAISLSNLGNMHYLQGKFADAEKIHRRVLAIREKVLGPTHPDTATSLNNLANVRFEQGKDQRMSIGEQRARSRAGERVLSQSEIEALYRRALAIQERSLGPEHPALATTLNNLSAMLDQQGKHSEAEPLQRRALGILERSLGPLHPDTASTLTTLAVSLDRQGKLVEAERAYVRAVQISRQSGNPRILLLNSSRLGFSLAKRGRYREALPYYREAIDTLDSLYVRTRGLSEETRSAFLGQYSNIYLETIKVLLQLHRGRPQQGYDRQILEVASRNQSRIFTEMLRQADVAKFSSDPAFLQLRGRREQLQERLDGLRQALVTIPPGVANSEERRGELSAQLDASGRELRVNEDQLWRRYPRFMELTNPRPVSVDDLQQTLLKPGEALLSYVLLPQETVIFAVTRTGLKMVVNGVRRDDIARRVHAIRRSIDKVTAGESVLFLREIEPAHLHTLYRDLVLPVADVLGGVHKVIVVGDGALQTIPLELFVTRWGVVEQQAYQAARDVNTGSAGRPFLGEYALPEYLGKQHRFAYLPSLSALSSQRLYPKPTVPHARELVAFADPDFEPGTGKAFSAATRSLLDALGSSVPRARDGTPALPRLKETAEEAREIAELLGGSSLLYIGDQAQERRAKQGELRNARVVLFATHGFLAGEFLASTDSADAALPQGARAAPRTGAQPALALTLVGDLQGEDGLLTMKEVIEDLELNADLVALSACNTAGESAQANNGEGFAGLTRAFMFAGAKSLLVSHWSVDSLSTQALMTSTFRNMKNGEGALSAISTAQRELLSGTYTNGPYHFSRSHPFFWAPFVYVGD